MSKINVDHVFTSESVSEGHPDKVCDQISDAILDACLSQDAKSRVACETLVSTNLVVNAGEITCAGWDKINPEVIVRNVVREIGYDRTELEFCADTFEYICRLHGQSPDIAQGVDEGRGLFLEQGAGDQGMMFGYASDETESLMPAPVYYSHLLLDELQKIRKAGTIPYLRPDAKSQVSIKYVKGQPHSITSVVISHQTADIPLETIRKDLIEVVKKVLEPTGLLKGNVEYFINPTGKFVIGGPHGDAGLTGRKIIVDTYGGVGSHGGGAFSGKDPSKVDRSAAYYARYVAKNIVASELAKKCEVQVAYAIGMSQPISILVETFGTNAVSEESIEKAVRDVFDLRPGAIVRDLDLKRPIYAKTAAYGHFGRPEPEFTWEALSRLSDFKAAVKL